jgi:hypothetical protein
MRAYKVDGCLKQQRLAKTRGRTLSTGRRRDCLEDSDGGKEGKMSQSTANMTMNKDTWFMSPQIWGRLGRCNGIRVHPYSLETAYQWLKPFVYALYGCMKWSEVDINLNYDIMASFSFLK